MDALAKHALFVPLGPFQLERMLYLTQEIIMCRAAVSALLTVALMGCPTTSVDDASRGSTTTAATSTPSAQPSPSPMAKDPSAPIGADEKQRRIGALNKKGIAIKKVVRSYIEKNSADGLLSVPNGPDKTESLKFHTFHDPVRQDAEGAYVVLADFAPVGGEPGGYFNLAFSLKDEGTSYAVTEVRIQSHPVKQGDNWVKTEHFPMHDGVAAPLK